MNKFFDVLSLIVVMGIITTIVSHRNSKDDINAIGNAFSGALRAAMGK